MTSPQRPPAGATLVIASIVSCLSYRGTRDSASYALRPSPTVVIHARDQHTTPAWASRLPASIKLALGYKGSGCLCVSVVGDGDFRRTSNALRMAARYRIPLLIMVFNNRSYDNDEERQERMAVRREGPVENKSIGIDLKDLAPDLAAMARGLSVEGFGPITEPDQLGPTLDRAIEIVQGGKPADVNVVTQPRQVCAPGTRGCVAGVRS